MLSAVRWGEPLPAPSEAESGEQGPSSLPILFTQGCGPPGSASPLCPLATLPPSVERPHLGPPLRSPGELDRRRLEQNGVNQVAQLLSARLGVQGAGPDPARRAAGSDPRPGQTGAKTTHLLWEGQPARLHRRRSKCCDEGHSECSGERGPLHDCAWGRVIRGWPREFRDPRVGGDPCMPSEPSELSLKGCVQTEKIPE